MAGAEDIKRQVQDLRAALRGQQPAAGGPAKGRAPAAPTPTQPPDPAPGARKPGRKSDCVRRVEEMQAQRETRRKRALEAKQQRLVEAKDAEGRGGIEVRPCTHPTHAASTPTTSSFNPPQAVDFLRKIREYKEANGLGGAPVAWSADGGADVWQNLDDSSIRVCVRGPNLPNY